MFFYRYVSSAEAQSIRANGEISSKSGVTYFATQRFALRTDVETHLAGPGQYDFLVGPIPADEAPDMDAVAPRTASPFLLDNGSWLPGGGTEAATSQPTYLLAQVALQ